MQISPSPGIDYRNSRAIVESTRRGQQIQYSKTGSDWTTRMKIKRHAIEGKACWRTSEPEDRCIHDEGDEQYFNWCIAFFFASARSLSFVSLFAPDNYLTFSFNPPFDWRTFKTSPEMICSPRWILTCHHLSILECSNSIGR
jgi:hypothetical protein